MQAEQEPRGVLLKREVSIELGEKFKVSEVIVPSSASAFEGAACQVGQFVVSPCNGEGGKVGGLVGNHAESQCSGELLANFGGCAAHSRCPGDS